MCVQREREREREIEREKGEDIVEYENEKDVQKMKLQKPMKKKIWKTEDELKFEWQQVPQVSMTFLSILPDLNRVVVWVVSTLLLIFKSSSSF